MVGGVRGEVVRGVSGVTGVSEVSGVTGVSEVSGVTGVSEVSGVMRLTRGGVHHQTWDA